MKPADSQNPLAPSGIDASQYSEADFWRTVRRLAAKMGRPLLYKAFCLYYVLQQPQTPLRVKLGIMAALAYLVSPLDMVLDLLPVIGFADDLAVIAGAWAVASPHISPDVEKKAKTKLEEFLA